MCLCVIAVAFILFLNLDRIELAQFSFPPPFTQAGKVLFPFGCWNCILTSQILKLRESVKYLYKIVFRSIKEHPADTCGEIRASEGGEMADGKYWIYSEENSKVIQAYCKGKSFHQIVYLESFFTPLPSLCTFLPTFFNLLKYYLRAVLVFLKNNWILEKKEFVFNNSNKKIIWEKKMSRWHY